MNKYRLSLLIISLILGMSVYAASNSGVSGVWTVQSGDARVEITTADRTTFDGSIVWLREPTYPKGDRDEGKTKVDRENPDEARHSDPVLGLKLLKGFKYDDDNVWKGGTIYDPKNGKTYSCKMTLTDNNTLEVRGYIGISLLGRTEVWKRYMEETKQ
jgi:uncharacterized protein (DUF2147 family)